MAKLDYTYVAFQPRSVSSAGRCGGPTSLIPQAVLPRHSSAAGEPRCQGKPRPPRAASALHLAIRPQRKSSSSPPPAPAKAWSRLAAATAPCCTARARARPAAVCPLHRDSRTGRRWPASAFSRFAASSTHGEWLALRASHERFEPARIITPVSNFSCPPVGWSSTTQFTGSLGHGKRVACRAE